MRSRATTARTAVSAMTADPEYGGNGNGIASGDGEEQLLRTHGSHADADAAAAVAADLDVHVHSKPAPSKPNKFALPGKPARKRTLEFRTVRRRKNGNNGNNNYNNNNNGNNYNNNDPTTSGKASPSKSSSSSCASLAPLIVAVFLWYSLGVVSISSSKVLLTPYTASASASALASEAATPNQHDDQYDDKYEYEYQYEYDDEYAYHRETAAYHHVGGLPPLFLTVQQLLLGSTLLRLAIRFRLLGLTKGIVPLDVLLNAYGGGTTTATTTTATTTATTAHSGNPRNNDHPPSVLPKLVWTGIYFALGFLTTNLAFGAAAPTYVETLKAAEPITSAIFAVVWGIERLTLMEVIGLAGIVGGVLLSTNGSNHAASMSGDTASSLATATAIVMASNLCFSLRGLYQKLFRRGAAAALSSLSSSSSLSLSSLSSSLSSSSSSSSLKLDDLNLQFRMQQTGVALLAVPTLLLHGKGLFLHATGAASHLTTPEFVALIQRYLLWSVGNGLAFSSYNLASTYLLTRISVVHHAALNCTRRIFAIVCTGLLFRIPISMQSMVGIGISFASFMLFTWAKANKTTNTNTNKNHGAAKEHASSKEDNDTNTTSATTRDIPNGVGSTVEYANAYNGNENVIGNGIGNSSSHHNGYRGEEGLARRPNASAASSSFARPPPQSQSQSQPPLASKTKPTTTFVRYPPPPPPPRFGR